MSRIQEAQEAQPDIPLGTAEQFLLTLASVSGLEARLRLWAFKVEFELVEKEVCEPLMDLKVGVESEPIIYLLLYIPIIYLFIPIIYLFYTYNIPFLYLL